MCLKKKFLLWTLNCCYRLQAAAFTCSAEKRAGTTAAVSF
eukprot:06718.XXX_44364_44483_1 [CDS] Oithona nana genome sequencing.